MHTFGFNIFNASKNSYDLIQYSIHKIDTPNIPSGTDICAELNDFFYADKRYIYELNKKNWLIRKFTVLFLV